jgi:prepilin-type N-terminal cleavage/methylation domain-containing protein
MKKVKTKLFGFTLIELMISIAVIGIILTVATISFSSIRENSRNVKRVKDIKQIQLALEEYYRDHRSYPEEIIFGGAFTNEDGSKIYLASVPENPKPRSDGECENENYNYFFIEENGSYNLSFCLSKKSGKILNNYNCATPVGIFNHNCLEP